MKSQDKQLYELFQQMLESPEQVAPQLDISARSGRGVEDMTAMVDFADRLRERSTPVCNAEVALSRAKKRILASMPVSPVLAESPVQASASHSVVQAVRVTPGPWQAMLDIFRAPAIHVWATASIVLVLFVFVTGYMGIVFSANAMPGDAAYPLKRLVEQVTLALSFDPVQKSERLEDQNRERLREARSSLEKRAVVRVTFTEAVEGRDGAYWIIGGIKVLVDEGEELLEHLDKGSIVSVEGIASSDGVILQGVIRGSTPIPGVASTPSLDPSLPGTNLESQPTDTPAPIPTKKPTRKPTARSPVRTSPPKRPTSTRVVAATATPDTSIGGEFTPTVIVPDGTETATPLPDATPDFSPTSDATIPLTATPDTTPVYTETPTVGTPVSSATPEGIPTTPTTAVPAPTSEATPDLGGSPTPDATDTPEGNTPTPSTVDTVTPPIGDTPTPPPVETSTPLPADTPTAVPTDSPSTNTPVPPPTVTTAPPPATSTPEPPPPTNTPVPPPPPTNTPAPPPPTSTPVVQPPTPTPL